MAGANANLTQHGQRAKSEEHRLNDYDVAHKATENTVTQATPPVDLGHPPGSRNNPYPELLGSEAFTAKTSQLHPEGNNSIRTPNSFSSKSRGRGARNGAIEKRYQSTRNNNDLSTTSPRNTQEARTNYANRKKQQKIKQLLNVFDPRNFTFFKKYYVLKFPRLDINKEINLFATSADINKKIGPTKNIRKVAKDSLLIEVHNDNQGQKLANVKSIANLQVLVEAHKSMNQVQGTIYSEALANNTEEEILAALKDQGVTKVERIKTFARGQLTDTHRYILTFKRNELPDLVRLVEWHHEPVQLYVPEPMRCSKCQKFGHSRKWCRKEEDTCAKCSLNGHRATQCSNDLKCANCLGPHHTASKQCPVYLIRAEIMATKVRKNMPTFLEAEDEVRERCRIEGRTFSQVVRTQRQTTSGVDQSTELREMSTSHIWTK